jgi:TetR/AcrR family transcriptional regulator, cholesterol catabolism regulator
MAKVNPAREPKRKMAKKPGLKAYMQSEIFRAAGRAMVKRDFASITMEEIAEEMGSSKGTIYYYFRSKDQLMSQMAIYLHMSVGELFRPIWGDKSLAPLEKFEKLIRTYVVAICNDWVLNRALWTNAWWTGHDIKKLQQVIEMRRKFILRVGRLIAEINRDRKESALVSETRARMVVHFIESITGWYTDQGPLSADQVAEMAVQYATSGMKPSVKAKK